MEFTTVLFYIFALLLVVSALKVITSRNPVASALFLVLAFFNAAAIWMLLQAEFLAILLVLVYVGAVMVLFLFVVMMLDINLDVLHGDFKKFVPHREHRRRDHHHRDRADPVARLWRDRHAGARRHGGAGVGGGGGDVEHAA